MTTIIQTDERVVPQLLNRIHQKNFTVGVVGMGYVGLPLMLRFAEVGLKSVGFDISSQRVDKINQGQSYIKHIQSSRIDKYVNEGKIRATTDYQNITNVDAIIICVPTPLTKNREPDLSYITDTLDKISPYLRQGHIISLESTTYPGTTDEVIKPRIDSLHLTVGEDVFLVYSPEREDPGNENFTTSTIPKVVGGYTKHCLALGISLYESIIQKVVPVSSTRAAEMTKLLENIHRSVNIGLVNEMKLVAQSMDIDIYEVIDAAATKPFGFVPYYPGPGIGGHCIPIDPFYLTWKAREYGLHTRFIELAGEINNRMPLWTVAKISEALNEQGKSIKNSKVLLLGLSYKKDIDDCRESPSLIITELLFQKGANYSYCDPYVSEYKFNVGGATKTLSSIDLTEENIKEFDCIVVSTDHSNIDYDLIRQHAQLIVDTRGVFPKDSANVVRA